MSLQPFRRRSEPPQSGQAVRQVTYIGATANATRRWARCRPQSRDSRLPGTTPPEAGIWVGKSGLNPLVLLGADLEFSRPARPLKVGDAGRTANANISFDQFWFTYVIYPGYTALSAKGPNRAAAVILSGTLRKPRSRLSGE